MNFGNFSASCPFGLFRSFIRIFRETRCLSICKTVDGVPFFGSLINRCTWFGITT